MDKKQLRQNIRVQKRAMTEEQITLASEKLVQMFLQTAQYQNAKTIYAYLPYNQEVRTVPIVEQAFRDGKKVAVPKIYGDKMRFLYISDLKDVEKGYCGIPEPIADEPEADDETALVLMPGMAFTKDGKRIGYGGGYYDKFLANEPNHPTVALCYDFQIVDSLPTQSHDFCVDLVLWA